MRCGIVLFASFLGAACAPSGGSFPSPCPDNYAPFSVADTTQGVRAAAPIAVFTPRPSYARGTVRVRLLVSPLGRVLRDSTHIIESSGHDVEATGRDALEQTRFRPAVRNGCAVPFWYEMSIRIDAGRPPN